MVKKIKNFSYNLIFFIVGAVIWIILKEELSLVNFLMGGIFTAASFHLTNKYLLSEPYHQKYNLSLCRLIIYFFYLVLSIFAAGFKAVYFIVFNKTDPSIVKINSTLDNDFLISILANSITLTPGTVTIDKNGKELIVLCIVPSSKNEIVRKFETILSGKVGES